MKLLQTDKRQIKPTRFQDLFVKKKKIIQNQVILKFSKPFQVPHSNAEQYRNSFFVKTIARWNYRSDDQVKALNSTGTLSLSKPLPAGITGMMTK
ncbi:hypothetical protein [Thiolapillus sp.]|uniref:hypothetical protein n=1 Tax=Thiolapillus sp. TaxID=2017437 RepID=UPI003AF74683